MSDDKKLRKTIRDLVTDIIREEVTSKLKILEDKVVELGNMQNVIVNIQSRMTQTEAKVKTIESTVDDMDKSITFVNKQITELESSVIPSLDNKFRDLTTKVCMNLLDMDTHRRKWSLILNGLKGEAKEHDSLTREKVKTFGKEGLKVTDADSHNFAACHRLAQNKDSGVIVKFLDLSQRNMWLTNAKNLKGSQYRVSITPDLHPCLRKLKINVLQMRKDLTSDQRNGANVRYSPSWPYVYIRMSDGSTKNPQITKQSIVKDFLHLG